MLLPSQFVLTLVLTVGALLVLDTLTGMLAARKKGIKISFAKFGRLVEKMLGTAVLWITLALLGNVTGVMLAAPKIAEALIAGGYRCDLPQGRFVDP